MSASRIRQLRLDIAGALAACAALALALFPATGLPADDRPGSTAVISWEAPGDDDLAGIATRYQVRFRVVPLLGTDTLTYWNAGTVVSGAPAPGWPGTTDSIVVTGLNPSVAYYFIVRAADEVPNWSGFSNIVEKPALPDRIPPATVEDLSAVSGAALVAPPRADTLHAGPAPPR